jgi:hypothetical protein
MKWNILVGSLVLGLGLCTQSFGFELLDRMLGIGGCGCDAAPTCCAAPKGGCDSKCGGHHGLLAGRCCNKGCDGKGGCDAAGAKCGCEAAAAKCGCDAAAAKCGCDNGHGKKCGCDNGCNKCRQPLFGHRCCDKGCGNKCDGGCGAKGGCDSGCGAKGGCAAAAKCGCDAAAATCGCEAKGPACGCDGANKCGCDKGCKSNCGGLLDRIFGSRCCKSKCGSKCDGGCHAKSGCEAAAAKCGCEAAAACGCDGGKASATSVESPMPPAPVVDPSAFIPSPRNVVHATSNLVR